MQYEERAATHFFPKSAYSYPHAKLPKAHLLGALKWTFFAPLTESDKSFPWLKYVIRAQHRGFLVRNCVLLSGSNHRISFWAKDISKAHWMAGVTHQGWWEGHQRVSPVRGQRDTWVLTAGPATTGRVVEVLRLGLLNQGFELLFLAKIKQGF